MDQFCFRCGAFHTTPCERLPEFTNVLSVTRTDSALGQDLVLMKRRSAPTGLCSFRAELLPLALRRLEEFILKNRVRKICFVPASENRLMRGVWHPNIFLFRAMKKEFRRKHSLWNRLGVEVALYLKDTESRSQAWGRKLEREPCMVHSDLDRRSYFAVDRLSSAFSRITSAEKPHLLFVDDVLTTGVSVSRFAALIDPKHEQTWHLLTLCRTPAQNVPSLKS